MKHTIPYRIIIIGGNHLNTLSVIRCLGRCGCDIQVLIHTNQPVDNLNCANSHYSKGKTSVVEKNEKKIIQWLIDNQDDKKQIVFPCSDFAAFVLDNNADLLKKDYYLPGFFDSDYSICHLMNKWNQKELADKMNLPMAKSWLLSDLKNDYLIPDDVIYPCIIKPNTSAFGVKSDITICYSEEELLSVVKDLRECYQEGLLIQEYLHKTDEYDCMGCVLSDKDQIIQNTIKKIYDIGGNTVYARFSENSDIDETNKRLISSLYEMGYRGMFDIEYIIADNQVYLIEINFRHSGVGFGLIKNKVYAPYIWCLDVCGLLNNKEHHKQKVKFGRYLMDETVCFNHRKEFGIGVFKWLRLCLNRCSLAKFDIHDLKGTFFLYKEILHRN